MDEYVEDEKGFLRKNSRVIFIKGVWVDFGGFKILYIEKNLSLVEKKMRWILEMLNFSYLWDI